MAVKLDKVAGITLVQLRAANSRLRTPEKEPEREVSEDCFFDPWLASAPGVTIFKEVSQLVVEEMDRLHSRQRARTRPQAKLLLAQIEAILCNVVDHALHATPMDPRAGVAVAMSKNNMGGRKSRYAPGIMTTSFPDTVRKMIELGWLERRRRGHYLGPKSYAKPKRTTIGAGPKLALRIADGAFSFEDTMKSPGSETIVLREKDPEKTRPGEDPKNLEYRDAAQINRYREEMRVINTRLQEIDLVVDPVCLARSGGLVPDLRRRHLRRIFSKRRFDRGGRLYGGFWMEMRKEDRFGGLRIDGRPIVELDYGQAYLRIIYGEAGQEPPMGDLYAIEGLEGAREGVKRVVNALLFDEKPRCRMPRGGRPLFGHNVPYADVEAAILEAHPVLKRGRSRAIGHWAMFVESQIMVDVLLRLGKMGIGALPIHDAVLVADTDAEMCEGVMASSFERIAKTPAVISRFDRCA